jgi:hypothetical protein
MIPLRCDTTANHRQLHGPIAERFYSAGFVGVAALLAGGLAFAAAYTQAGAILGGHPKCTTRGQFENVPGPGGHLKVYHRA